VETQRKLPNDDPFVAREQPIGVANGIFQTAHNSGPLFVPLSSTAKNP
jgi:hypothetical protein